MSIRNHEDLICWQLAHDLEIKVHEFTARRPASRNFGFCDQIRESSSSAPANISEGFYRYRHAELASSFNTARGELGETKNHLRKAFRMNYISREEFDVMWRLVCRAMSAALKFQEHAEKTDDPPGTRPAARKRKRRRRT
jgi:four helix bundle protein